MFLQPQIQDLSVQVSIDFKPPLFLTFVPMQTLCTLCLAVGFTEKERG